MDDLKDLRLQALAFFGTKANARHRQLQEETILPLQYV